MDIVKKKKEHQKSLSKVVHNLFAKKNEDMSGLSANHPPTQTKTKGSKMLPSVTDTVRTGLAAVATFFGKDDKSATFRSKPQGLPPF